MSVLVLNQGYLPIGIISWERAFSLVYSDKADVIKEYDEPIRSVSQEFKKPAVIRIKQGITGKIIKIRFNKGTVFLRDNGTCQYCKTRLPFNKATYDHVLPKSRGGPTTWTNIVTSCSKCNQKKDCLTPEEARMPLVKPQKPSSLPLERYFSILKHGGNPPSEWQDFIKGGTIYE